MHFRVLAAALLLVGVALGVEGLLSRGMGSEQVRTWVVRQLDAGNVPTVHIGDIRLSLFPPKATASPVRYDADHLALDARQVAVRISPWSLLTGGVRSFDIAIDRPHISLRRAPGEPWPWVGDGAEDASDATPLAAGWQQLAAHRIRIHDARVTVADGDARYDVDGIHLAIAPDVTLHRLEYEGAVGAVRVGDVGVMDGASFAGVVDAAAIQIERIQAQGPMGVLTVSGEVRAGPSDGTDATPRPREFRVPNILGLQVNFSGDLSRVRSTLEPMGFAVPDLSGSVTASGRVYGPWDKVRWEGEVSGTDLALVGQPRTLSHLEARLRVVEQTVEVIHGKVVAGGGELRGSGTLNLGDAPTYDLRFRADDVAVAWLLNESVPYGAVVAEGRLFGLLWEPPDGRIGWRYRNPEPLPDHPEGIRVLLWQRVLAQSASVRGEVTFRTATGQVHDVSGTTPDAEYSGTLSKDPDGQLAGRISVDTKRFSEVGRLLGLPYVDGRATAKIDLSGTLVDYRAEVDATLRDGRIREHPVEIGHAQLVLTRGHLHIKRLELVGAGTVSVVGKLDFPPRGQHALGPIAHVNVRLHEVPLRPFVGIFFTRNPLALDLPASGKLQLVRGWDGFSLWGDLNTSAGHLYGQYLSGFSARMWLDQSHMTLTDARLTTVSRDGRDAVATGHASMTWRGGRYEVALQTGGLPLASVDTLAKHTPFLDGTFAGRVTLVGDLTDPLLTASGRVRDFVFREQSVGDGDVAFSLSRWQVRVAAALSGAPEAPPSAHLTYYTQLRKPGNYHLSARMLDRDLRPWLQSLLPGLDQLVGSELGADYGARGSGHVSASGGASGGVGNARIRLTALTLDSGTVTTPTIPRMSARLAAPVRIEYGSGMVDLQPMQLVDADLDVTVRGSLEPGQSLDLHVDGRMASRWIEHLRPEYRVVAGEVGLALAINGPWASPRVVGRILPDGLALHLPGLADDVATLTLDGEVVLSGHLSDPLRGTVRGAFHPLQLSLYGYPLAVDQAGFTARDGVFKWAPVEWVGAVGRVQVEGGFTLDETVAMKAVGSVDMDVLLDRFEGVADGIGSARITAELSGDWQDPDFTAGAELEAVSLRVPSLERIVELTRADVLLRDGTWVVDPLTGMIGAAEFSARGQYQMDTQDIRAVAQITGYTDQPRPGLTVTVDADLALGGVYPAPTLSGDVHLRRAVYNRRMQWSGLVADLVTGKADISKEQTPFGNVRLEVRIAGDENITVDNNLAYLVLDVDVVLGGTVAEPGMVGRVDVRSGQVTFRDNVLELDYGSIDFVSAEVVDPYVDVGMHTTVEHALPDAPLFVEPIDVDVSVSGRLEQLDLGLRSRPHLSEPDLLSLLAVGYTTNELSGGGFVGAGEATNLVTGKLQQRLEEQVHRFTGLDRFEVDPFYADETSGTSGSARVSVGKKLFDGRGQITYSTVVDASQEPNVQFSYRVGPRVSVLFEQDSEGRKGGDVRYRIRFR